MAVSIGDLPADVHPTAQKTADATIGIGGLAFGYGQGSVFVGFSRDADLDFSLVWDGVSPPPRDMRPVSLLCDEGREPVQFDEGPLALDKLWIMGRQVDVAHHTMRTFGQWLEQVRHGDGWQESVWPLPLFAVAGFFDGVLLDDTAGVGASAYASLTHFPVSLIEKTNRVLARNSPRYQEELAACVRRGDDWLFHDLLGKWMRDSYSAWFAAERHYCPHPKRLSRWIARFQMDSAIAATERQLWDVPTLDGKLRLVAAMAEMVIRKNRPLTTL